MRKQRICQVLDNIDPKFVEEATAYLPRKRRHLWFAAAACLVLVFAGTLFFLSRPAGRTVDLCGIPRNYSSASTVTEGSAPIWPWEYLGLSERYTTLTLDGKQYGSRGAELPASLLGDALGAGEVSGYDIYTDETGTLSCDIYAVKGVDPALIVAAKLEDSFYLYRQDRYAPPATLGEMFQQCDLPQLTELSHFTAYRAGEETGHYALESDDALWSALADHADAPFVEDDNWFRGDRDCLCFTLTSEALGVYKRALYITADGYLWTNCFDYAYIFHIGTPAAEQIISACQAAASPSQPEAYSYYLCGTLTQIGDGYILVDDSILCTDAAEGITFRVALSRNVQRKYIEFLQLQPGTLVQVEFRGSIDPDYTVNGAVSVYRAYLHDGHAVIPE